VSEGYGPGNYEIDPDGVGRGAAELDPAHDTVHGVVRAAGGQLDSGVFGSTDGAAGLSDRYGEWNRRFGAALSGHVDEIAATRAELGAWVEGCRSADEVSAEPLVEMAASLNEEYPITVRDWR
jgi:hypothetical protein